MFGKMMNNYYYGKSGKGDFRKEDLPQNRRQLFADTLKTRLSALCRINLLYTLIFLPAIIVTMIFYTQFLSGSSNLLMIQENDYASYVQKVQESEGEVWISEEDYNRIKNEGVNYTDMTDNLLFRWLIWLIPCIAITGPFTAGLSYVTRNWARDEHAFIWTDLKDAVKENWKQSLVLSVITSILPVAAYVGWKYYGSMAERSVVMMVPQVLVVLVGVIWAISITYMHPMVVTYELKLKDVIRNGLLLGIARLPWSVGIRLLHCVPALIAGALCYLWNPWYGMLILMAWYVLIGFSLSRFVTASYTNAVFDRFINSRIEGAKVNQGMREPEDDEDGDEDEESEAAEGNEGD